VDKVEIATLYDEVASSVGGLQIDGISQSDPSRAERIIIANTARDNSRMINAPLGEDIWKDINVKILSNETSGNALMVNFPLSMEHHNQLMDQQYKIVTGDRAEREKIAQMGFEERKQIREIEERKQIRDAKARKADLAGWDEVC
jgi:hypothetical protein